MKTIKITNALPATSNDETFISIETTSLDDVTGGCAACGQPGLVHAAPATAPAPAAKPGFNLFSAFARR